MRRGSLVCLVILLVLSMSASCKKEAVENNAPESVAPVAGTSAPVTIATPSPIVSASPDVTSEDPQEDPLESPTNSQPQSLADRISRLWSLIDGSTATIPLTAALYNTLNTGSRPPPVHNTTPNAYWNLITNRGTDLIFVTYPSEDEFRFASECGVELEIIPIVKDALVLLVNVENPVVDLTVSQLHDIYTGSITNWSDLGGNDEDIIPYQRSSGSGSQTLFLKLLMKDITPMAAPTEWITGEMDSLIEAVSSYDNSKNAIGYSMFYFVNNMYGNDRFKLLGVDGVRPSRATIERGEYPLEDYYYAVIRKDTPGDSPLRELIDWLLTDEGQSLAIRAGYIPVRPIEGVLPDNTVDPIYLGDTINSSGTGGTVLKSGVEDAQPVNGVRPPLSAMFFDGFNYISYINDSIMQALERVYNDSDGLLSYGELFLKQPFTGIPNDYPNYEIRDTGWLRIIFPDGNPFFGQLHERTYYPTSFTIRLTDDISPYGAWRERYTTHLSYYRRMMPRVDLFTYSFSIPDNPEVADRINEQLKEWTDGFPGSGIEYERLIIFLGNGDWVYSLRPYTSLWRDYLGVSYSLSFYDGGGLGVVFSICFDINTGDVVNLLDEVTDYLDFSKARVEMIVDWDISETGHPSSIRQPGGYVPAEGSVITGASVTYHGFDVYLTEPDGRVVTLYFSDDE